jgi:hypothetical protein
MPRARHDRRGRGRPERRVRVQPARARGLQVRARRPTERLVRQRGLRSARTVHERVSLGRLRCRRHVALHTQVQLSQQSRRIRCAHQCGRVDRNEDIRVHFVDRGLRRGTDAHARNHGADAGGSVWSGTRHIPPWVWHKHQQQRGTKVDSLVCVVSLCEGVSKYAVELDLQAAHRMFPSLDFIIFRPHNVYGPGQNIADRYRNVIGIFLSQVLRGEPLSLFGDGVQTRCFSFIDDVAPIIALAPLVHAARNQVFNIGSDSPTTLLQLADTVFDAMTVPPEKRTVRHLPPRLEVTHAQSDHAKVRCVFGLNSTQTSLGDGIRATIAWVRAQGVARPPIEFDSVEVMKNIPESWVTESMRQHEKKKVR